MRKKKKSREKTQGQKKSPPRSKSGYYHGLWYINPANKEKKKNKLKNKKSSLGE